MKMEQYEPNIKRGLSVCSENGALDLFQIKRLVVKSYQTAFLCNINRIKAIYGLHQVIQTQTHIVLA